eukprot:m.232653 g.232653  ORF g.232653 m.232653 type:complete len:367 (+) comp18817_c0_seq1:237-1337(+)
MATKGGLIPLAGTRGKLMGPLILELHLPDITFKNRGTSAALVTFHLPYIRRFGQTGSKFIFEAGSRCVGWEGVYEFSVESDMDIPAILKKGMTALAASGALANAAPPPPQPPRPASSAAPSPAERPPTSGLSSLSISEQLPPVPARPLAASPGGVALPPAPRRGSQEGAAPQAVQVETYSYTPFKNAESTPTLVPSPLPPARVPARTGSGGAEDVPVLATEGRIVYTTLDFGFGAAASGPPPKPKYPRVQYDEVDLKATAELKAKRPARTAAAGARARGSGEESDSDFEDASIVVKAVKETVYETGLMLRAVTLFANVPDSGVELAVPANATVFVLEKQFRGSPEWCVCALGNKEGILPTAWLKFI